MCNLHGAILLTAFRCCFLLFSLSKNKSQLSSSAKLAITEIINHLFQRIKTTKRQEQSQQLHVKGEKVNPLAGTLEKPTAPSGLSEKHRIVADILNQIIESVVNRGVSISSPDKEGNIVEDIMFADFCMIFVYICQASVEIPKGNNREVNGKPLALQILHTIICNSAITLRSSKKFINEILREHLVSVLMGNGNTTGKVFQYVISIFVEVFKYFREYLKDECGTFVVRFLLPKMEATNVSQELYWVLQIVSQWCKDATLLLDLFVNYDCDEDQEYIFQRCIESLCKTTSIAGQRQVCVVGAQEVGRRGCK